MKYQFTIEKTEQGYRVTRDDFLGYSAAVAPDDLGDTIQTMVEFAPPASCLLQELAYGVAYGVSALSRR